MKGEIYKKDSMIDLKYLKLILAIDKNGSLKKASTQLNLTQSALSHQLKKIEDYLGIAIFNRSGNQLLITEAGKELKEKGGLILNDLNVLELRILEIKQNHLKRYIHGYSESEAQRLKDQAKSIEEFLHYDSLWEIGSTILEVGCGVGAQTEIIAQKNKGCRFNSIDISKESIKKAQSRIKELGISNVKFQTCDVYDLNPKEAERYDHVFVCFILEHVSEPEKMLQHIYNLIKPGGSISIIEGDHGSTLFFPENNYTRKVINAQIELQRKKGGNANIGRQIYPLLQSSGYSMIEVSPRQIYVDNNKKALIKGFIENTFTAMMKGIAEDVIHEGLISKSDFELGIKGLMRTTNKDGIFSYTFFKGHGIKK